MNRPISIMPNVQVNIENMDSVTDIKEVISNDNEDQEIPSAIEDIIEQLIQSLRDKAITIRYECASLYITIMSHSLEIEY